MQDAPFFTVKLGIKVLPAVLLFRDGVAVDRTVGFADFGARDTFSLAVVERRLARSGVLAAVQTEDDSDKEDEAEQVSRFLGTLWGPCSLKFHESASLSVTHASSWAPPGALIPPPCQAACLSDENLAM